jgi:hypothetical protein
MASASHDLTQPLAGQPAGQGSAPDSAPRQWWQQLATWGLANAMKQHTELTNARVSQLTGSPVEPIPFGNVTNITSTPAPAPAQAPAEKSSGILGTLMHAGLGGGMVAAGLGLAKLLTPAAAVVAPPVAPPVAPIVQQAEEAIPLIIDWELNNGGQPGP